MAMQISVAMRNATLAARAAFIGPNAQILIYSGTVPINSDAPETGALLARFALGTTWMQPPVNGQALLAAMPLIALTLAIGLATHFRITQSDGATCHIQGTVSLIDGGGDLELTQTQFTAVGQSVTLASFPLVENG